MAELKIPTSLGKYPVIEMIAEGGMGTVYRGHHPELDLDVAIKLLPPDRMAKPGMAERFLREARLTARLNHPNIVRVLDCGVDENQFYLVMEFVKGQTISELVQNTGPLGVDRALEITHITAGALDYAFNELGIIHRDIKADNLMLTEFGLVKLADLGLARAVDDEAAADATGKKITRDDIMLGTPEYMGPEQFLGKPVDHRADIYALGITLYFMLCGEEPFQSENLYDLIRMVVEAEPPPLPAAVPEAVGQLVTAMIAKRPEQRPPSYADLQEMLADLRQRNLKPHLGGLAMKRGYVTESQVDEVWYEQQSLRHKGRETRIGELLVNKGYLESNKLKEMLAEQDETQSGGKEQKTRVINGGRSLQQAGGEAKASERVIESDLASELEDISEKHEAVAAAETAAIEAAQADAAQYKCCQLCFVPVSGDTATCPNCGISTEYGDALGVQPLPQEIAAARNLVALRHMLEKSNPLRGQGESLGLTMIGLLRGKCPHCRAKRDPDTLFCANCWAYLGPICPACRAQLSWSLRECPACKLVLVKSGSPDALYPPWAE